MSTDPPSAGCYCFVFCLMATMLICDLACNVITTKVFVRKEFYAILGVSIFQVVNILFALLTFCYCIFRTNVAKAGFVGILFKRFRATVIITILYLIFTIALHAVTILIRYGKLLEWNWPIYLKLLFFVQRTLSVLWYYTCKRAILRLGDPRFYDEEWVRHTLVHHDTKIY